MESVFQLAAGFRRDGDPPSDRAARHGTRARREQLYAEALAVIEARHGEPLDVDDVARAVFASRRQLQRVFAEVGGTTVREAIARTRLERAAQLLRDGGTPVKDVGAAVGLGKAAQFAKAFRRRYGVSPSEYRRAPPRAAGRALGLRRGRPERRIQPGFRAAVVSRIPSAPVQGQTTIRDRGFPMKKTLALTAACASLALVAVGCGNDDDESGTAGTNQGTATAPARSTTIVAVAKDNRQLATLVQAVTAARLAGTLEGKGPFTVFAPTNAAFAELGAAQLKQLLLPQNRAQLRSILTYHVVPGELRAADLKNGQKLKTVQGDELTVRIAGGEVKVGGATVVKPNVDASNGVVHVIDGVLTPPSS